MRSILRRRIGRFVWVIATLGGLATIAVTAAPQAGGRAIGAAYFPAPGDAWEHRAPEQVGMDAVLLDKAIAFARSRESTWNFETDQIRAFGAVLGPLPANRAATNGLVIRHGYIVAEFGETTKADPTYSAAKSFLSTLFGLALDRGLIKDVHDPVKTYVDDGGYDAPHNAKIEWHHHLQQTSEWEGSMWGKPHDFIGIEQFGAGRREPRAIRDPGTYYEYNDVRINRLALSLLRVWKKPLPQVLKDEIMDRIGASTSWQYYGYANSNVVIDGKAMPSVTGGTRWGGGLWIPSRDQARFGYLFLRNGKWKDRTILSERWIRMATTRGSVGPDYGYLWWLNTERKQWPSAPATSYAASGNGSNIIWIDPDDDLVVVWRWFQGSPDEFFKQIRASIKQASQH